MTDQAVDYKCPKCGAPMREAIGMKETYVCTRQCDGFYWDQRVEKPAIVTATERMAAQNKRLKDHLERSQSSRPPSGFINSVSILKGEKNAKPK